MIPPVPSRPWTSSERRRRTSARRGRSRPRSPPGRRRAGRRSAPRGSGPGSAAAGGTGHPGSSGCRSGRPARQCSGRRRAAPRPQVLQCLASGCRRHPFHALDPGCENTRQIFGWAARVQRTLSIASPRAGSHEITVRWRRRYASPAWPSACATSSATTRAPRDPLRERRPDRAPRPRGLHDTPRPDAIACSSTPTKGPTTCAAHVRTILTDVDLTVPVTRGELALAPGRASTSGAPPPRLVRVSPSRCRARPAA